MLLFHPSWFRSKWIHFRWSFERVSCFWWHFRVSFWQLNFENLGLYSSYFKKKALRACSFPNLNEFFHYFYIGNMFTLDANMFILLVHKLSSLVSFPVCPECHTNFNYLPFRCDLTWSDIERVPRVNDTDNSLKALLEFYFISWLGRSINLFT